MARDILAIPLSTVASKSAFSAGGLHLDQYRSSLTPKMTQALICSNDWLRAKESTGIDMEEKLRELEEVEKGNKYFMNQLSFTMFTMLIFFHFLQF
ncbi:putative AC transposase [Bienertia sinuspersici]